MTDENDTNEEELSVSVRRPKRRGGGEESEPVLSDVNIPIFPDFDKDSRHVVTGLLITKLTMPGEGHKGQIPPTATLESIGRRFGDGRYNIHAVNQENKVLRRLNDVAISVGVGSPGEGPKTVAVQAVAPDMTLLNFQAQQHEKDAVRVATFAKESSDQARALTEKHLAAVERQSTAQAERDRAFYTAQSESQQAFFANLMAFSQQGFLQTMQLQQQQFQQTITMLEQGHQRALAASDPTLLVTLFKSGLDAGRGLETDNDDNPLVKTAGLLVGGMKEAKQMMLLKNSMPTRNLPQGTPQAGTTPAKKTDKKAGKTAPDKPVAEENPTVVMQKLAKLKATLDAKGIDFVDYLEDVQKHIEKLPDEPDDDEDSDETDESGEDDTEESGGDAAPNGATAGPT